MLLLASNLFKHRIWGLALNPWLQFNHIIWVLKYIVKYTEWVKIWLSIEMEWLPEFWIILSFQLHHYNKYKYGGTKLKWKNNRIPFGMLTVLIAVSSSGLYTFTWLTILNSLIRQNTFTLVSPLIPIFLDTCMFTFKAKKIIFRGRIWTPVAGYSRVLWPKSLLMD